MPLWIRGWSFPWCWIWEYLRPSQFNIISCLKFLYETSGTLQRWNIKRTHRGRINSYRNHFYPLPSMPTINVSSKSVLDPRGELMSISLTTTTYPNQFNAHGKESAPPLPEMEDYINEHGSYIMNTSSNPCSHETSPESIGLSNIATPKIFNPLILLVYKDFERVVVDTYVYHKYCKSHWHESWDRYTNVGVGGETTLPITAQFEGFPRTSFCAKTSTFGR